VRPAARVVPLEALQTSDRRHARIFMLSRPTGNALKRRAMTGLDVRPLAERRDGRESLSAEEKTKVPD
jgi:hypothetical protein